MTKQEEKAYIDYVFSHALTPEESKAYMDWVSEAEDKYGCDISSIPIEGLETKTDDEIWQMIQEKREERRKRNALKAESA